MVGKEDNYKYLVELYTPEHPISEIYTRKRDDEHPRPFHMPSSPPGGGLTAFGLNFPTMVSVI